MNRLMLVIFVLVLVLTLAITPACQPKSPPEPEELLEACKQGDIGGVEKLIEQNVEVNALEPFIKTPLMHAAG